MKGTEIVACQDFDWDCMDSGVFAVKVAGIPKNRVEKKEIARQYRFYCAKAESEIEVPCISGFREISGPWEDEVQ